MEVCGDGEVEAQKVKTEVSDSFVKCCLSADDLSRGFNVKDVVRFVAANRFRSMDGKSRHCDFPELT